MGHTIFKTCATFGLHYYGKGNFDADDNDESGYDDDESEQQ
jgi:hypothetical protein